MYNSKTSIMEKRQEESLIWLDWAKELQFIAQAGLTYSKDPFDLERFQRIREISAEIVSRQTGLSFERVTDLFCGSIRGLLFFKTEKSCWSRRGTVRGRCPEGGSM